MQITLEKASADEWERTKRNARSAIQFTGLGLWAAGQPIIPKRFVTPGASRGTSIASVYFGRTFRQKVPKTVLGVTVPRLFRTGIVGRVIGRAVPVVGGTILVIDAVRTLIDALDKYGQPTSRSWGGSRSGNFGGGGATGEW